MPPPPDFPIRPGKRLGVFVLGALVCLSVELVSAAAAVPNRSVADRGVLTVGVTTDSYPYGFVTPDGKWSGYSSDLMDALGRTMKLKFRREVARSSELHRRFKAGDYDLLQAYSQSEDRESFADFSVPYLTLQGAVFVSRNGQIRSLEDFNGRKFANVGAGAISERFLRDRHLTPVLIAVSSAEEGLRLVNLGQVDGVFMAQLTAASLIERHDFSNVKLLGEPIPGYDIRHCFAVHEGDAELLARINEGLAILNRTGEFQQIYDRWFSRINGPLFTREQVISYVAATLAIALVAALWGFARQRALRKRLVGQAAELAGKEALLAALYDNIPMAICVIESSSDGWLVMAINRQAEPYFGLPPSSISGQLLDTLTLKPEWAVPLRDLLRRWPADGTMLREERKLTKQGKVLMFTLVSLPTGAPGRTRACVIVEDVSERRQLDEEVAQGRKLRAVGELVGGIAHEFNNLLTPVILKVDQIQLERAGDTLLRSELNVISSAARHAAELTRRLLTFGRKTISASEPASLHTVVNSVFILLRQTMDRRIQWVNDVSTELPPLFLNVTDLNQVILNLLINARDTLAEKLAGNPEGWSPRIQVEAANLPSASGSRSPFGPRAVPRSWLKLTVRDNGMGIPAEVRDRIFEPFFTTKEVGKGTGLGLATVWHLVTSIGGTIETESSADLGTAFHVMLPVWPATLTHEKSPIAALGTGPSATRVLVVEDEDSIGIVVCAVVNRAGHAAERFGDGAVAWRHLESHWQDYGLLIFDINMPGLTGIELARRVRGIGCTAPLIIMSGRLSSAELDSISEARVSRVLPKPFTMDELLSALRDSLPPAQGGSTDVPPGTGGLRTGIQS